MKIEDLGEDVCDNKTINVSRMGARVRTIDPGTDLPTELLAMVEEEGSTNSGLMQRSALMVQ